MSPLEPPFAVRCTSASRRYGTTTIGAVVALLLVFTFEARASVTRLPSVLLPPPTCQDVGRSGRVRGLVVGVDQYRDVDAWGRPWFAPLEGSVNDARLLAELLTRRAGALVGDVKFLAGPEATSDAFYASLNDIIARSGCGDFVFIHFSGHTWRGALALADASVRNGAGLVFESEMRRAVTALRNRGAFVLVHIDANVPEPLELDVGQGARWRAGSGRFEPSIELAVDAGGFAGFYAGPLAFEQRVDITSTGRREGTRVYGLFSFVTAAAMEDGPLPSLRVLAERIQARMTPRGRPGLDPAPVFESTEPDRKAFAVGLSIGRRTEAHSSIAVPQPVAGARHVEIVLPRRTRGVSLVIPEATLRVEGIITPDAAVAVVVYGTQARLLAGGRFEATVQLRPGPQTVYAVALFADHSMASDSVDVNGGATPILGPAVGRSYALVVGNSGYRSMPRLRTPASDADAVAALLATRFGFELALRIDAQHSMSLVLKDVGRRELFAALSQLRRVLGENDSLLVFYAGHGDHPRGAMQAYWLPVDAEPDDHANWISADDIASEVALMNARHVLIVADSCFSGGLLRSGAEAAPPTQPGEERMRWLDQVARRRSRHLMSSGANEPVLDAGAPGHSVFAQAFLDALAQMPEDLFTAQQVFSQRVQEVVAGRSGQTPQYGPLLRSGHDGGDFVFRRIPSRT